jgi:hypothetical protein
MEYSMGIYDKAGQIHLIASMLEAMQWNLEEGVIEAAVIEVIGKDELLTHFSKDDLRDYLGEHESPAAVFTYEDLEGWAIEQIGYNAWCEGGVPDEDY